jgi:hypothetical protein
MYPKTPLAIAESAADFAAAGIVERRFSEKTGWPDYTDRVARSLRPPRDPTASCRGVGRMSRQTQPFQGLADVGSL